MWEHSCWSGGHHRRFHLALFLAQSVKFSRWSPSRAAGLPKPSVLPRHCEQLCFRILSMHLVSSSGGLHSSCKSSLMWDFLREWKLIFIRLIFVGWSTRKWSESPEFNQVEGRPGWTSAELFFSIFVPPKSRNKLFFTQKLRRWGLDLKGKKHRRHQFTAPSLNRFKVFSL